MNKIAMMIASGEISVEELASVPELIERANLVIKGIDACKLTLNFPFGKDMIDCYDYTDTAGEYHSWGNCSSKGIFTCYCNWGGSHMTGACDLTNFSSVFIAFENSEFEYDLKRFLKQQIEAAEAN